MSDPHERARIAELGTSIATLQDAELEERADLGAVRSRLLRPRRRVGRGRSAAAAALALGALGAVLVATTQKSTLRLQSDEGPLAENDWVATEGEARTLRVSDGSSVVVAPDATLRIAELGRRDLRLDLQAGEVRLDATRGQASIELTAGPFRVTASGSRSTLRWAPAAGSFGLTVTEGDVQVEGPTVAARTVRAGEDVRVALHERRLTVAPSEPVAVAAPAPDPAAEEVVAPAPPRAPRRDWRALAARGDHAAAARAAPFEAVLRRGDPESLLLLGNAARLGGDPARAGRAYERLVERHGDAGETVEACFRLGRMAQLSDDPARAAQWLERAWRRDPHGALAVHAAGRLIDAYADAGDAAAAREAATRYLEAFPDGPHEARARAALSPTVEGAR